MEKIKVDLYVKGDICLKDTIHYEIIEGCYNANVLENDNRYDFSDALIIEGNLICDAMRTKTNTCIIAKGKILIKCCSNE